MNPWQSEIESWGREILSRTQGETPRIFERKGLAGRLMGWSMRDEALKVIESSVEAFGKAGH